MKTSRRGFIGSIAATSLAGCGTWQPEEKALTIGFMTDTHILKTRESCARVEGAYKVFKREGCDVIVNAGDIADWFYPSGYKHYRDIANETYPDANSRPQEIFVYANHDTLHYPRKPGESKWDAFPHVKELLKSDDRLRNEIEAKLWENVDKLSTRPKKTAKAAATPVAKAEPAPAPAPAPAADKKKKTSKIDILVED